MNLEPFQAIDGLRYWYRGGSYCIRSGVYGTGHGALWVVAPDGQVEFKITVNMTHALEAVDLTDDELCVRWAGDEGALTSADFHVIDKLKLFVDTGKRISSGFVEHYAAVWRFERCVDPAHESVSEKNYVVGCLDCRMRLKAAHDVMQTQAGARDAVQRLDNLERMEAGGGHLVPVVGRKR